MTGKDLHKAVKDSGIKIKEIVEKSGIPEQTIYSLYRKKTVEAHYLESIEGAGIELYKTTETNKGFMPPPDVTKEIISLLQLAMARDQEKFKKLEKVLDTYDRLINQAIDTGAIKMEKK